MPIFLFEICCLKYKENVLLFKEILSGNFTVMYHTKDYEGSISKQNESSVIIAKASQGRWCFKNDRIGM